MWGSFGLSELQRGKRKREKNSLRQGGGGGKDLGIERGGLKQREGELNRYTMKYPSVGVWESNDKEIRREKPGKQM